MSNQEEQKPDAVTPIVNEAPGRKKQPFIWAFTWQKGLEIATVVGMSVRESQEDAQAYGLKASQHQIEATYGSGFKCVSGVTTQVNAETLLLALGYKVAF